MIRSFIITPRTTRSRGIAVIATFAAFAGSAHAEVVYGLTTQNGLIAFDSATPGALLGAAQSISGLQPAEIILGIDARPRDDGSPAGRVFAISDQNRMYRINPATGAATLVSGGPAFSLSGVEFGFDFNPTVDRIRVTSNADQNIRLNPLNGGLAATDINLAYAVGDVNAAANPNVVASAYTNNFDGATTTTLYNIDSELNVLVTQSPPNNGTLNTVGSLGFDTTHLTGFDISGASGVALASLSFPGDVRSQLATVNLVTGAATLIGVIGGTDLIRDITFVPEPCSIGLLVVGTLLVFRRR